MFTFNNDKVRAEWKGEKKVESTQSTKVEGVRKETSREVGRAYMYANPVEREMMIIQRAQQQQIANEQRLAMFNVFSRKNNK